MEDIHKEVTEKLEALVLELFPDGAQVTSTYFDYIISSEIHRITIFSENRRRFI